MIKPLKHALLIVAAVMTMSALPQSSVSAAEPSWTYGVVRVGESRDAIKSMPITERPYRPLHVYGNTPSAACTIGAPLYPHHATLSALELPRFCASRFWQ